MVSAAQFTAGAAGPLLHLSFLETALDRRTVVATNAFTQSFSHALKIGYVAMLLPRGLGSGVFGPTTLAVLLASNLVGTWLGALLLGAMKERTFRLATTVLFGLIGATFLARGLLSG